MKPDETAIIFISKRELFLRASDKNSNSALSFYKVQTVQHPLFRGENTPSKPQRNRQNEIL